jgi:hypothetical protein
MYGCRIQPDSTITFDYSKTSPMKPVAFYLRTPMTEVDQFCNNIIVTGISKERNTTTVLASYKNIT